MSTTIKAGWLNDKDGNKFAPKTLSSQIQTSDGTLLEDKIQADLDAVKAKILVADWNQSDPNADDYVKNRTHYEEVKKTSIEGMEFTVPITNGTSDSYGKEITHNLNIPLALGQIWKYKSIYNGDDESSGEAEIEVQQADDGTLYLGDLDPVNSSRIGFRINVNTSIGNYSMITQMSVWDIKIIGVSGYITSTEVKQLDEKYIPDTIARTSDKEVVTVTVTNNIADKTATEIVELVNAGKHVRVLYEGFAMVEPAYIVISENIVMFRTSIYGEFLGNSDIGESFMYLQIDNDGTVLMTQADSVSTDYVAELEDYVGELAESISGKADAETVSTTYETKEDATAKLDEAKAYADTAATTAATTVKNDLLNGAGESYDTLKELGDLINENTDALQALETVATGKADKVHNHDDVYETKTDAQTKLDTANTYTDSAVDALPIKTIALTDGIIRPWEYETGIYKFTTSAAFLRLQGINGSCDEPTESVFFVISGNASLLAINNYSQSIYQCWNCTQLSTMSGSVFVPSFYITKDTQNSVWESVKSSVIPDPKKNNNPFGKVIRVADNDASFVLSEDVSSVNGKTGAVVITSTDIEDVYSQSEIDTLLESKSDTSHSHDDVYYTETEIDAFLAEKKDKDFVVTISGDDNTGYTSDKTATEIYEAYNSGKYVYAVAFSNSIFHLTQCNSSFANFEAFSTSSQIIRLFVVMNSAVVHQTTYLYNETEVDNLLATKADLEHSHDDVYYTETEIDTKIDTINESLSSKVDSSTLTNYSTSVESQAYTDNAVAQKTQVQIITWEADD